MKSYLVVFLTVFLAELGDKTQLATLLFATDSGVGKTGIFLASALALVASAFLAVIVGAKLGLAVPAGPMKVIAGLGFVLVGVWMLVSGLRAG
jgi:putative Ca2+/H+ antiporter (TMEM165/GDT1 family)